MFTDHGGEDNMHDEPCCKKSEPDFESLCENWGKVTFLVKVEAEALGMVWESLDCV